MNYFEGIPFVLAYNMQLYEPHNFDLRIKYLSQHYFYIGQAHILCGKRAKTSYSLETPPSFMNEKEKNKKIKLA